MTDPNQFHYVHRAGRSKKRRGKNASGSISLSDLLRSTREGLVSSGWWDNYRAEVVPVIAQTRRLVLDRQHPDVEQTGPDIREVGLRSLCLGLGSPIKSAESRAQLCVLLDLCAELAIKGAHVIDTPTLVYMPHCGIGLYERFLRANWSGEGMNRIILVANDMAAYTERNLTSEKETPILNTMLHHLTPRPPRLRSLPFPTSSKFPGAFNNTALQVLDDKNGGHTWTLAGLPEYSDEDGEEGEVR
ncbi:SRR1 [Rhizoctonia solani]|uniref:SRR1 n=1 Tax=Rhizoctonia solani TaxID=456999 RepID=A0A8H7IKF0_9AGAM|nr:SRR1 [Rhizoctonia solani]